MEIKLMIEEKNSFVENEKILCDIEEIVPLERV